MTQSGTSAFGINSLLLMFISHARFLRLPPEAAFVPHLLGFLSFVFLFGSIAGLFAGIGLLQHAPWARMLAIVLGAIALLLYIPFGTALGIYTLWVLLPEKSEEDYRRMSLRSVDLI